MNNKGITFALSAICALGATSSYAQGLEQQDSLCYKNIITGVSRTPTYPPQIFLYGLRLSMDKKNVNEYLASKNVHQMPETGSIYNMCRYVGDNINMYNTKFDNIDIYYDNDQRAEWIAFKAFIPKEMGTQDKIFKNLYEDLYRKTSSCRWEGKDYNYLFTVKNKYGKTYVRLFVEEVLQGEIGYNVVMTCGYNAEKIKLE